MYMAVLVVARKVATIWKVLIEGIAGVCDGPVPSLDLSENAQRAPSPQPKRLCGPDDSRTEGILVRPGCSAPFGERLVIPWPRVRNGDILSPK